MDTNLKLVRVPLRKEDERKVRVGEQQAHVFRLVAATGQTMGIMLSVLPPHPATCDYKRFTDDDGNSFRYVSHELDLVNGGVGVSFGELETNPEKLATLRHALERWREALE